MPGLCRCVGFPLVAATGGYSDCSVQASHCGGFLLLWSTGSIVVAHRLSCSATWGIFPNQGSNPCLLHWRADPLPLSHQGSPTVVGLKSFPGLHMSPPSHLPPHPTRLGCLWLTCVVCGRNQHNIVKQLLFKKVTKGFPGGSVVKNLPANAGDMGSISDPGRSHVSWSN